MALFATSSRPAYRKRLEFEQLELRDLMSASPVDAPGPLPPAPESERGDANSTHLQQFHLSKRSGVDATVVLANESDFDANFTLKFNGQISVNIHDLVRQIRELKVPGSESVPDYEKAYHYLLKNHEHDFPLSGRTWMHEPSLYLNSLGAGLCDDAATALSLIWKAMGYQSRIWLLQGHVVAEVRVGDRWQMYDPDLRVSFFSRDGLVAGVEELGSNPDLITAPTNPTSSNPYVYSVRMAQIYSSVDDNRVCSACADDTVGRDLIFQIPAGGTMELGEAVLDKRLPTVVVGSMSKVGQVKITVPPGSRGSLDIPLAIYDVRGQGTDRVRLGHRSFRLATSDAFDFLHTDSKSGNRIQSISFNNNKEAIEIIYFLNRKFVEVQKENTISIGHQGDRHAELRAKFGEPVSQVWDFGQSSFAGASVSFHGREYLDISHSSARRLFRAGTDFEVSARVKVNPEDKARRPIADANRFSLEIDEENRPYAYYRDKNEQWVTVRGPAISTHRWHDITVSLTGGTLSLKLDGVTVDSRMGGQMSELYPMDALQIGKSRHMGGLYFRGEIDKVSFRHIVDDATSLPMQTIPVTRLVAHRSFSAA